MARVNQNQSGKNDNMKERGEQSQKSTREKGQEPGREQGQQSGRTGGARKQGK